MMGAEGEEKRIGDECEFSDICSGSEQLVIPYNSSKQVTLPAATNPNPISNRAQ